MRYLVPLLLLACAARGEVIDRIAVTVDARVITESMVIQQIRLSAFQDGREPVFTPQAKRQAAGTLVSQTLLVSEMDDSRYPEPPMAEILEQVEKMVLERFHTADAYRKALAGYELQGQDFLRFLQQQQRAYNFIDVRFRTGQQVGSDEIREYYEQTFAPEFRKQNPGQAPPALDAVSAKIEELLMSRKVDTATGEWLKQAQSSAKIRYREEVFE
jgi:hypothetical protein